MLTSIKKRNFQEKKLSKIDSNDIEKLNYYNKF